MKLIRHFSANSILDRMENLLLNNEVCNNLILGVLYSIADDFNRYGPDPYLAVVEDNENIIAIAVMTPPYNLLIYSDNVDTNAYTLISRDLLESEYTVPGVNGIKHMSSSFTEIWSFENLCTASPGMGTMAFRLDEVIMPDMPEGRFIKADIRYFDLLCDWMKNFAIDTHLEENFQHIGNSMQRWIDKEKVFLWESGNQPVSMAVLTRPLPHGETISGVYTPKELRNHGYASAVVAYLSQHILDSGKEFVCLFTDIANPVSNSIYQKIGYKKVCQYQEYKF